MKRINLVFVLLFFLIMVPSTAFARITPEDIINSKKEAYSQKVQNYSPASVKKLDDISKKIVSINKRRTNELDQLIIRQGELLDEYQARNGGTETEAIKNARYWITYAHEAVAYQAAKIYVFELTNEQNLKNDMLRTVGIFEGELNSTRQKVIKAQNILQPVLGR